MPDSGGDSPTVRRLHAATCIEHGGDRPQLVIIGGVGAGDNVLNDVWIMDVQSGRWKEVIACLGYLLFIMKKLTLYMNISESVVVISIWGCNFWLQPQKLALNIVHEIYTHISCPIDMRFLAQYLQYFTFNSFLQNSDEVHTA